MQSVGISTLTSHIALKRPAPQEVVCRSGWANFGTEEGTESLVPSTLTSQGYFKAEYKCCILDANLSLLPLPLLFTFKKHNFTER